MPDDINELPNIENISRKKNQILSTLETDSIILMYAVLGRYNAVSKATGISRHVVSNICNTDEAKHRIAMLRAEQKDMVSINFYEALEYMDNGLTLGLKEMAKMLGNRELNKRGDFKVKLSEKAQSTKVYADILFKMTEIDERKQDRSFQRVKLEIEKRRLVMIESEFKKRQKEDEKTGAEFKGFTLNYRTSSKNIEHLDLDKNSAGNETMPNEN